VIEAVGVVVPAHDEETLLPSCLAALGRAARRLSVPVHLLVAADSCADRTADVARACGARVISVRARCVGAARAAGMTELLRLTAGPDPAAIWLATTDADTLVPPHWLQRQVEYAGQGWDVVLGTVTVADWSEHPPHVPAAFAARYQSGDRPHPHVHGANIGIRAAAYQAAGGFPPLRTAEDHALLAAVAEAGCSILRACDLTVQTSARRRARAPHGFSHLLRTLTPMPQNQLPSPAGACVRGPVHD
jgi:glycosyltransferase involved in cell wall biosynthesis